MVNAAVNPQQSFSRVDSTMAKERPFIKYKCPLITPKYLQKNNLSITITCEATGRYRID